MSVLCSIITPYHIIDTRNVEITNGIVMRASNEKKRAEISQGEIENDRLVTSNPSFHEKAEGQCAST